MCNCNNTTNCGGGCLGQTPCTQMDCSCPIMLISDCINNVTAEMPCSGIAQGQTLTAVLEQLDAFICTKFNQTVAFFTLINVGTGSQIYKGVNGVGQKEIRSIITTGALLTNTQNTNDITLAINEANLITFLQANQKTYTVANIGVGAQIYKDSTILGNNTQFNLKKLKSIGSTVTITEEANEINFEVTLPSDVNITAGANVTVTEPTPNNFVITSTDTIALLENSVTATVTGNGTIGNEYKVEVNNLQKTINTFPYTLSNTDDKYSIFVANGASNVIINIPNGLVSNFSVVFIQEGTGTVTIQQSGTATLLYPSTTLQNIVKGQYFWAMVEKKLATDTYYLLGSLLPI